MAENKMKAVSNNKDNQEKEVLTIGTPPKASKEERTKRRDLSNVQVKREVESDNGKVQIIRVKSKNREPLPVSTIITIVAITLLALFMMMNYAELESANASINELENQLTELKSEKKELEIQIEKATDLTVIEQYAHEILGMDKPNKKFPISLLPTDSTEIMEYPEEDETRIETIFSGFGEIFSSFLSPRK